MCILSLWMVSNAFLKSIKWLLQTRCWLWFFLSAFLGHEYFLQFFFQFLSHFGLFLRFPLKISPLVRFPYLEIGTFFKWTTAKKFIAKLQNYVICHWYCNVFGLQEVVFSKTPPSTNVHLFLSYFCWSNCLILKCRS